MVRREVTLLETDQSMQRIRQTLRQWTIQHGPAVLPTLATGALALLLASHAAEQVGRQPAPSGWAGYISSWLHYIPEWLSKGFLICIITGWVAFMAYRIAREYRVEANSAAVSGSMTVAVLTWATQWCSTAGSIAAGLLIAGVIVSGVVCIRARARRRLWKTIEGWWPNSESKQARLGTIQFAQIVMAMYFGAIALIAISGSVPPEFRWKVLAFAGIGITAASVLSDSRQLNNLLAMFGVGIGLWGGYLEMNRAAAMVGGEVNAGTVMLVAGIMIYIPLTALALRASALVRVIFAPVLVFGLVLWVTFSVTGIIAIIISTGCNLGTTPIAVLLLVSAVVSFVFGAATFFILAAIEIANWFRRRKGVATPSENQ